jgi:replicative DNA helicase
LTALAVVTGQLEPRHFYREAHSWIYQVICDLYQAGTPADFIRLTGELAQRRIQWAGREQSVLDAVGGAAYMREILNAGGGGARMAEYYARDIEHLATRRSLYTTAHQIAGLAFDGNTDLETVLGRAETLLRGVTDRPTEAGFLPITAQVLADRVNALHAQRDQPRARGVPTGIGALDALVRWRKGQLIVPAARPAQGKTALVLGWALAAAAAGYSVGIASLEMDTEEILDRYLAMVSGVPLHLVRQTDLDATGWDQLRVGGDRLGSLDHPIHLLDAAGLTVAQLRGKAYQLQARAGLDLLIVDYLQLMEPERPNANRVKELGEITRGMKNLARKLRVPVIAPSQLSRAIEGRADHRPQLSDLRESGSIENDADVVIFIYRPDPALPELAELLIAKHRNGPAGDVPVYWEGQTVRFYGREDDR